MSKKCNKCGCEWNIKLLSATENSEIFCPVCNNNLDKRNNKENNMIMNMSKYNFKLCDLLEEEYNKTADEFAKADENSLEKLMKHTREESIKMLEEYYSNNYEIDYKVKETDELDIKDIMVGDYTRIYLDPFKYISDGEIENHIKLVQSIYNKEDK